MNTTDKPYLPSALVMFQAIYLTSMGSQPKTDAIFVHGSPAASDEIDKKLLFLATSMLTSGDASNLVINGLTDQMCVEVGNGQRLAYPGCDTWGKVLEGMGLHGYMLIPPSKHTAAESDAVIKLAQEKGWGSVTIMSYPHHILRCLMQMVFCLARARSSLKVYTKTLPNIDWQMNVEKGVLGGEVFRGSLVEVHAKEEFERIIRYANMMGRDTIGGFTPHWDLEALIAYCKWRDGGQVDTPIWERPDWIEYLETTKLQAVA